MSVTKPKTYDEARTALLMVLTSSKAADGVAQAFVFKIWAALGSTEAVMSTILGLLLEAGDIYQAGNANYFAAPDANNQFAFLTGLPPVVPQVARNLPWEGDVAAEPVTEPIEIVEAAKPEEVTSLNVEVVAEAPPPPKPKKKRAPRKKKAAAADKPLATPNPNAEPATFESVLQDTELPWDATEKAKTMEALRQELAMYREEQREARATQKELLMKVIEVFGGIAAAFAAGKAPQAVPVAVAQPAPVAATPNPAAQAASAAQQAAINAAHQQPVAAEPVPATPPPMAVPANPPVAVVQPVAVAQPVAAVQPAPHAHIAPGQPLPGAPGYPPPAATMPATQPAGIPPATPYQAQPGMVAPAGLPPAGLPPAGPPAGVPPNGFAQPVPGTAVPAQPVMPAAAAGLPPGTLPVPTTAPPVAAAPQQYPPAAGYVA